MSMLERLQQASSLSSSSSSSSSSGSTNNKTSAMIDLTEDVEEEEVQPPLKQPRTQQRTFNIASQNVNDLIARYNEGNFPAIRQYLNQKSIDVILLQEVWIACGYTGGYPGKPNPSTLPHKIRPKSFGFQAGMTCGELLDFSKVSFLFLIYRNNASKTTLLLYVDGWVMTLR